MNVRGDSGSRGDRRPVWPTSTFAALAAVGVAVVVWTLVVAAAPPGSVLIWTGLLVVLTAGLAWALHISGHPEVDVRDAALGAEQFRNAVVHVAHEDVVVRAGGFYQLGMVWRDYPQEHQRVLEFVLDWLRTNTSRSGPSAPGKVAHPPTDASAALWELLRRPQRPEDGPLDLTGARLEGANLRQANLQGAILTSIDLTHADLTGADLTGAVLNEAMMIAARLPGAVLRRAKLQNARLQRADLTGAILEQGDLTHASVSEAVLVRADLTGAVFVDLDLRGADLTDATGVTGKQLQHATGSEKTQLPQGIDPTTLPISQVRSF